MSGTAWEVLKTAMGVATFSQRRAMWMGLQERVSRKYVTPGLVAWPDVLLFVADEDVSEVIAEQAHAGPPR